MNPKLFIRLFAVLSISVFFFTSCGGEKENKCIIRGTVVDRDSDTIYLQNAFELPDGLKVAIPIVDNRFEYEMTFYDMEAYKLIFKDELDKGSWNTIDFFPDSNTVEFELYPESNFELNKISGPMNRKKEAFYQLMYNTFWPKADSLNGVLERLKQENKYYSIEMNQLLEEKKYALFGDSIKAVENRINKLIALGKDKSKAALAAETELTNLENEVKEWRFEQMSDNPDLVNYFLFVSDLRYGITHYNPDNILMMDAISKFTKRFPDHPYTVMINDIITAKEKIKIGGRFIDFTAPDLKGNRITISTIINKHKVTYLDFWASWCSPCIKKSNQIKPVYNDFKDKGFAVIGIAREYRNVKKMENVVKKNKFPWINLVELNDSNRLWQRYDIFNSAGKTYLLDSNGVIVRVDPTANQVRQYLEKVLR